MHDYAFLKQVLILIKSNRLLTSGNNFISKSTGFSLKHRGSCFEGTVMQIAKSTDT